jgi:hypothetical protein
VVAVTAMNGEIESEDEETERFLDRWWGRGAASATASDTSTDHKEEPDSQPMEQAAVQRPLLFRGQRISFDMECRSRAAFREMNWYFPMLDRYLEAGYDNSLLVTMFRGIPTGLANVMKESLQAMQILSASMLTVTSDLDPSSSFFDPSSTDSATDYLSSLEPWEVPDECGCICYHRNPVTGVCTHSFRTMSIAILVRMGSCLFCTRTETDWPQNRSMREEGYQLLSKFNSKRWPGACPQSCDWACTRPGMLMRGMRRGSGGGL